MLSRRRNYSGSFEKVVMKILYYMQMFAQTLAAYQNVSFGHGIDIHKHLFPSEAVQLQKFSGGIQVSQKFCLPFTTCSVLGTIFAYAFFLRFAIFSIYFSEVCSIVCQINYKASLAT